MYDCWAVSGAEVVEGTPRGDPRLQCSTSPATGPTRDADGDGDGDRDSRPDCIPVDRPAGIDSTAPTELEQTVRNVGAVFSCCGNRNQLQQPVLLSEESARTRAAFHFSSQCGN